MKLKYTFESIDIGDEIVLVPVGENADKVKGIVKVNSEGLEIVELLKGDITKNQIVEILSQKYENDRYTLSEWVNTVIDKLLAADLIENN